MRNILDEIVRFYLEAEQSHYAATRRREEGGRSLEAGATVSARIEGAPLEMDYEAPPFRQAIVAACRRLGVRLDKIGDLDDDWHKDVRRAWDYEQQHDAMRPKVGGTGAPLLNETYYELRGWNVTHRIKSVIEEVTALECDFPADIEKALWILREMEKRKNP